MRDRPATFVRKPTPGSDDAAWTSGLKDLFWHLAVMAVGLLTASGLGVLIWIGWKLAAP